MNKTYLIMATLLLMASIAFAQTATQTPPAQPQTKGFTGVSQYVEKEELVIEVKSLIPPTGIFQDKSDTYQKAGEYKFSFTIKDIQQNSDILLNKWLKESK